MNKKPKKSFLTLLITTCLILTTTFATNIPAEGESCLDNLNAIFLSNAEELMEVQATRLVDDELNTAAENWTLAELNKQTSPVIKIELAFTPYPWGLKAHIKNIGDADITDVNWNIAIDDGWVLIGRYTEGQISIIPPENFYHIQSVMVIGYGNITITISAECAEGYSDELVLNARLRGFRIWF